MEVFTVTVENWENAMAIIMEYGIHDYDITDDGVITFTSGNRSFRMTGKLIDDAARAGKQVPPGIG